MIRHYLFPVVGIILGFSACRSSETNEKQVLMVKTETVKNYENELQVTYPGRVKAGRRRSGISGSRTDHPDSGAGG